VPSERVWSTSLHQTFRLLPRPSASLRVFLESDGRSREEVLAALPYESARARVPGAGSPDPKRYRDGRQVLRSVGLVYEDAGERLRVTRLGRAVLWWLDTLSEDNVGVIARYASYALSAWQLRNPTRDGRDYAADMVVFPYAFIWRVMLLTGRRITSEELARVVLKLTSESGIEDAAALILQAREEGDVNLMGPRVHEDNDRIISWMSLCSFGWTLITDKRDGDDAGSYQIPDKTLRLVERAAQIRRPHLEFDDDLSYFQHISRAAALPADYRRG
jgi:hypothetical protein